MNTTRLTSILRSILFAALLPLAAFADIQPTSATDAAIAAAVTAATNATIAKVTAPAVAAQPAAAPVAVTPAAPQGVAAQSVAPAKGNAPAWTDTRDAFLSFALDKAKTYTGKAEEVASKAVDAAVKEAGPLAVEFIHWRLAYHLLYGVTPLLCFALMVTLFMKQWPKWGMEYREELTHGNALNLIGTIAGAVGSVVFFVITCVEGLSNIVSAIQILVAPRVYMVEQVLHLFGK